MKQRHEVSPKCSTFCEVDLSTMEKELLSAALSGNQKQLSRILKLNNRSYDVNCTDTDGRTPLFLAAREGNEKAVQMLLKSGSDVHICCRKIGDTPLIIACSEGHDLVVRQLIEAGSDIDLSNQKGWTPLIYAAYYNHEKVVGMLIEHKANLDQTSQAGCNALYRASSDGREESVRLLIDAGADINLPNSSGNTPLSVASRNGHASVVKLLLEAGATVNTVDDAGLTPLHEALDYEKEDVVELLLTLGKADTSLTDPMGRRPVSLARSERIVRLLEEAEQTRRITETLAELQLSEPQLTQLDYKVCTEVEVEEVVLEGMLSVSLSAVDSTTSSEAPLTPNSGMAVISSLALSRLTSLAEASPLTIECLKQFGASVVQAELDYERIRKDPTIYEYYLFFIQAVSSAVLASQSIASGMIDDARLSTAETLMEHIDNAAQAVSWMGASIITGIGKILVKIPNVMDRQRTVRRITTFFPSIDSHKFIEILAREMTIYMAKDIHAIMREAKKTSKQSILDRVMRVVEWLETATNLSVVQGLACGHAAKLIDRMMAEERPFPVQLDHISVLIHWACDKDLVDIESREHSARISTPLASPKKAILDDEFNSADAVATSEADQAVIDDRIKKLEHRLSMERQQRVVLEQKQTSELNALKKQMKGLEAVNNIFSGLNAEGGLVNAHSAQSVHKTIEDHLRGQALQQTQQGEILRELTVRVDLLVEDNNLHSPVEVEVPGASQGSKVFSPNKGAPMGHWVNNKMSYTADFTAPNSLSSGTPPTSQRASSARSSTRSNKYDFETSTDGFVVDTPGCTCTVS